MARVNATTNAQGGRLLSIDGLDIHNLRYDAEASEAFNPWGLHSEIEFNECKFGDLLGACILTKGKVKIKASALPYNQLVRRIQSELKINLKQKVKFGKNSGAVCIAIGKRTYLMYAGRIYLRNTKIYNK